MMRRVLLLALSVSALTAAILLNAGASQAGGGGHCPEAPREGRSEPVLMQRTCFTPAILYTEPGASVEWRNESDLPHNVSLFDGTLVGDDASVQGGESVSGAFANSGVYGYYCTLHPGMVGVVVVEEGAAVSSSSPPGADDASLAVDSPSQAPESAAASEGDGPSSAGIAGIALATGLVAAGGTAAALRLRRRA